MKRFLPLLAVLAILALPACSCRKKDADKKQTTCETSKKNCKKTDMKTTKKKSCPTCAKSCEPKDDSRSALKKIAHANKKQMHIKLEPADEILL